MLLKKPKTLEIAYGGIAAALSTLLRYLASLLPTGRIALFVICALIPQFFLKRRRVAVALCMFFAVSFLTFVLLPDVRYGLIYAIFVGLYPLVRYACELLPKRWQAFAGKLLFCEISSGILFLLLFYLIKASEMPAPWWKILLLAQPCIVVIVAVYEWLAAVSTAWMKRIRINF